jgi:hypothetical protein
MPLTRVAWDLICKPSSTGFHNPSCCHSTHRRSLSKQFVQNTVESISLRLLHKRTMILFDLSEISYKIRFMRRDPLCSFPEFPEYVEAWEREDPVLQISIAPYWNGRNSGVGSYIKYENRNEGTSHIPFRKTV